MSKLGIFVSATIVLILQSSPLSASPQDQVPQTGPVESSWPSTPPSEDLQISNPPKLLHTPSSANAHYYPYQQQLTLRTGLAGDFPKISLNDNVIGFQYTFPKFLSPKLEAGADLHNGGDGHVHVGTRWFYNERGYFRPSLKLSGDILLSARENLATFAHIQNYSLRTTGTLEYVIWNPYSLRFENELFFGSNKSLLEITLGLSRGW